MAAVKKIENDHTVHWNEISEFINIIQGMLKEFTTIGIKANDFYNLTTTTEEQKKALAQHTKVLFEDINAYLARCNSISLETKTGQVELDDIASFYAVFEDLQSLHDDILTVIHPVAAQITAIIAP